MVRRGLLPSSPRHPTFLPFFSSRGKKNVCDYHESILSRPFTISGSSPLPLLPQDQPQGQAPQGAWEEEITCVAPLKPHVPSPPPKFGCIRDRQFTRKCNVVLERHLSSLPRGDIGEENKMYGRGRWELDEAQGLRWWRREGRLQWVMGRGEMQGRGARGVARCSHKIKVRCYNGKRKRRKGGKGWSVRLVKDEMREIY